MPEPVTSPERYSLAVFTDNDEIYKEIRRQLGGELRTSLANNGADIKGALETHEIPLPQTPHYMKRKTQRRIGKVKKPSFKTARFALEFRRSKIEGFGIYAKEDIPARKPVIEYTGEKITEKEADRRYEDQVRSNAPRHVYFFWLGRSIIDGSVGGSGAEYINHSCEPNLITWETRTRILLISKRAIRAGEELHYDYRFGADQDRYECRCGSRRCRGTINLRKGPQRKNGKRAKS